MGIFIAKRIEGRYTAGMPLDTINRLVRQLRTPYSVQQWLYSLRYNTAETMRSLHGVVRHHTAHCLEAALSAAALLEHHGYPPLLLDMESTDGLDHVVFVYQRRGKFGTVGWSRDVGLNGRKPMYPTIRSLVLSYAAPYIDEHACITAYGVLDLRTVKNGLWRTTRGHAWYIENTLRRLPHTPLKLSPTYVQQWRRRYRQFKRRYPHQSTLRLYPNRQYWI